MKIYEDWIRAHLPAEYADQPLDISPGYYLDGLTVMAVGERGGPDTVVYEAQDEEDLRYWQLELICRFLPDTQPRVPKTWRYIRHHAENGRWYYTEHRHYDYNAIEDSRLHGFECLLRNLRPGLPPDRWEQQVQRHVALMNYWYVKPHWDYDRERMCFVEISDSKECDDRGMAVEEPREGSVIEVVE